METAASSKSRATPPVACMRRCCPFVRWRKRKGAEPLINVTDNSCPVVVNFYCRSAITNDRRGPFPFWRPANEWPYRGGCVMNRYPGEPLFQQTAQANRKRLARAEREAVMQDIAKQEIAVRENMARLRELRLAKERKRFGRKSQPATKAAKPNRKSDSGSLHRARERFCRVRDRSYVTIGSKPTEPGSLSFCAAQKAPQKRSSAKKSPTLAPGSKSGDAVSRRLGQFVLSLVFEFTHLEENRACSHVVFLCFAPLFHKRMLPTRSLKLEREPTSGLGLYAVA